MQGMDTDINVEHKVLDPVEVAKTEFYESFPVLTIETKKPYEDGEITYILIPYNKTNDANYWNVVINTSIEHERVGNHALETHPRDSGAALELLRQGLQNDNISLTMRTSPVGMKKIEEASRVTLQNTNPIEREKEMHTYLKMALEIEDQLRKGSIRKNQLMKEMEGLGVRNPGLALAVLTTLMTRTPHLENFSLSYADIAKTLPNTSTNRETDLSFLEDAHKILNRGMIFSKKTLSLLNKHIEERYPEDSRLLNTTKKYKELVTGRVVFESAFNIINATILERRNIKLDPNVMRKLGAEITEGITSKIVTAYVKHTVVPQLGSAGSMLTEKNIQRIFN